jgi:hypothetical protein
MPYSSGFQAFFSSVRTWTLCPEHHRNVFVMPIEKDRRCLISVANRLGPASGNTRVCRKNVETHTHNEGGLLRCGLVQSDRYWTTFQRNCLPTLWGLTLMMEAVSSSETSVSIYKTTGCNVPQDSHLHTYCSENLKSHRYKRPPHCAFTYAKNAFICTLNMCVACSTFLPS